MRVNTATAASTSETGAAVARGLGAAEKWLPAYLFYDERGSRLFEQITELPEYYLTRAEREIFEQRGGEIAADAGAAGQHALELGAGTATKTQVLLRAIAARQGHCVFMPADVSDTALDLAVERISHEEVDVDVRPIHAAHEDALAVGRDLAGAAPLLILFIGSSIGNYRNAEAVELLTAVRVAMGKRGALLLGTDLVKSPDVLIPAYDDQARVTAEFNKNVLRRLNRELAADFSLDRFRHVALWNEPLARIEMHLESVVDQTVHIRALDWDVRFAAGERIHTESSHKYDQGRTDSLLWASGLVRERTYTDAAARFAVHLARRA